jgi:glycerate kinase
VADALSSGIRDLVADVVSIPLSDGGDGALDVAEECLGGERVTVAVRDPLGRPASAAYLMLPGGRAFIETAEASGLHLLADTQRRVLDSDTYGTGQLMADAVRRGASSLIVSAGGTASVDVGAGALAALGARFLAADGRRLPPVPRRLREVARVDLSSPRRTFARIPVLVLSDVATTLTCNVARFGPQKGITPGDAVTIREAMNSLAAAMGQADDLIFRTPLLGAGGGLAAGLHAGLMAEVCSGSDYFMAAAGLAGHISQSDLVITAEGRFDEGSLDGKLPYAVASLAGRLGKPAVIIAGECRVPASRLPPGVRCLELGLPPPSRCDAASPARRRALMSAARRAVEEQPGRNAGRS